MKTRLITSAVGVVIALAVLFLHNTIVFYFAIAAVCIILLFELLRAANCIACKPLAGVSFAYGALVPFFTIGFLAPYRTLLTVVAMIALFFVFILNYDKLKYQQVAVAALATIIIPSSISCCITLNAMNKVYGIMYVVLALCGAWLADSGAYFVGTFLGKHKLCPNISPKKTIEGFVGGVITNGLLFLAIAFVYAKIVRAQGNAIDVNYFVAFFLGNSCALIGTVGDLTASLIKRQENLKDYGNLMPGHGGLYDRFDSVLFVVPFFTAVVSHLALFS